MVKSTIDMGYGSRQGRFKRDSLNVHILLYDVDKEGDPEGTYHQLMDKLGKLLRKELRITKKGLDRYDAGEGDDQGGVDNNEDQGTN